MNGSIFSDIIAVLYLAAFIAAGQLLSRWVFCRSPRVVRITLGTALSLLMLMWLPALFSFGLGFTLLSQLLAGMQAGVGAVIASEVWVMGTDAVRQKNTVSIGIMLGAFLAACFFHVNVVYIILCCIVLGIVRKLLARRGNRR